MAKSSKKSTRQAIKPVSHSREQCADSLKNLCEGGFPFAEKIHDRAVTITPLLKEILEFRPRPHWR